MPLIDPRKPKGEKTKVQPETGAPPPAASEPEIVVEPSQIVVIIHMPQHGLLDVEWFAAKRSLVVKSKKGAELSVFAAFPVQVETPTMGVNAINGVFEFTFCRTPEPATVGTRPRE